MKLNCGPTKTERRTAARARFCNWHKWFAWRPVRVGSGEGVHEAGLIFEFTPYEFTYRPITN